MWALKSHAIEKVQISIEINIKKFNLMMEMMMLLFMLLPSC